MSDEKKPRLSLKGLEARVAAIESCVAESIRSAMGCTPDAPQSAPCPIVVDWTGGRGRVVGRPYGFALEGNGTQVTVSTGNGGVLLTAHPNGVRICVGAQVVEVRCDYCHVLDLYNEIGGHL